MNEDSTIELTMISDHMLVPSDRFLVLPRFGGHLKMGAMMRWEVSYDEEEAIQEI